MHPGTFPKPALALAAFLSIGSPAVATVMYDLRVTALNGVSIPPAQPQEFVLFRNYDTITFTVYARVTGAPGNAGVEGFQSGYFSLVPSNQEFAVRGYFVQGTVLPAFATGAFQGGTPTDTNGDGVNDRLGGQRTISTQARPPFDIFVRSGSTPNYSGTPIPDGQEFALMTADFVVTSSVLDVPSYFPTIAPSIFTSGIGIARFSAVWAEDTLGGTAAANRVGGFNSLNATAPNTGTITVGVPEPTAFGLLLGIVGLAGLRRPGICGR